MAEDIAGKKRIRAGHRGSTTKLLTRIDGVLTDSPTDDESLTQLKTCLNKKLETLKLLDEELVEHTADENWMPRLNKRMSSSETFTVP